MHTHTHTHEEKEIGGIAIWTQPICVHITHSFVEWHLRENIRCEGFAFFPRIVFVYAQIRNEKPQVMAEQTRRYYARADANTFEELHRPHCIT